ncbi:uncharacterized protein Z519_00465 [Cladophialophora bantiana CBS 173.52]|uniref:Anaphase-promoting complex subunit 11 RING-H2 finger domain-containing protein n=1 Tax=Cladophialophora bantiana (strain ATCC 10958 / CBS 173.52 / CDC B-1940 / NIH 8579) TaxID=1442370 RepID=A0A0D2GK67_CLAB1|nr:uncharacterized protein Z519_00465 [Cladophialophora bantiana CBS 173.52]KIW98802.1 hypothetical protein Z519_00465 [Cladophialophora bantiana CBS 173.52]
MSQQPRQVPTHSSSLSKPSSRRTTSGGGGVGSSGGPPLSQPQQQSTATRSLLPSPHFEDDPIVASHQQAKLRRRPSLTLNNPEYSEHAVAESENYSHGLVSAHPGELPIPSFQPFFTLIEDSVTNEHYHPTVHYIFADDDADIITEAALRSLEALDPTQRGDQTGATAGRQGRPLSHTHTQAPRSSQDQSLHRQDDSINAPRLPLSTADMREHYIILDVHPQPRTQNQDDNTPAGAASSGGAPPGYNYEVTSAHSLSAEWQVLRTSISTAPTIGDGPSEEGEGLMLRIEGRGNTPGDLAAGKEKEKTMGDADRERERERESLEEMIDRFQRRLDDIRMVIEAGGISAPVGTAALGGEE